MFNENDLLRDFNVMRDFPSNDTKKKIASRYGINSKKSAEIMEGILVLVGEIRSSKTEFTEGDFRNWHRMNKCSNLTRLDGVKRAFENESPKFQEYVREYYALRLIELKKKGFRLSMNDKYQMSICKTIERYFNEIVNKVEDTFLEKLIGRMEIQLKDYHDEYIRQNRSFFARQYDNYKEVISDYHKKEKELINKFGNDYYREQEYREFYKNYHSYYSKAVAKVGKETKEEYVEREIVWVEKTWKNDIRAIGERVRAKNMDEKNIKILNPSSDPKFIELHITDGIRNLWARSIIAAMNSYKVRPHYRFIITEQN